jgi:hypothetical protein
MANDVRITFRTFLPGSAGVSKTLNGVPVQGKALVCGRIVTTDVQSGLETVAIQDFGLTTLDFISVNVHGTTGGVPAKSATTTVHADYDTVNTRLVISDIASSGQRDPITNDEDPVLEFLAVGDTSIAPELT